MRSNAWAKNTQYTDTSNGADKNWILQHNVSQALTAENMDGKGLHWNATGASTLAAAMMTKMTASYSY